MTQAVRLAPVAGRARIDVLDVLRGLALLGIFYLNIPGMAQNMGLVIVDPRLIGWTDADRWSWIAVETLLEGTQRGVLELLFGAGMMVLTARAMRPDGPVAVADLYYRRNLWLLLFGLLDVFAMLWVGDILHVYALAALFLFPFRLLRPRWLVTLGLLFATFVALGGVTQYVERADLQRDAAVVAAKVAGGAALTPADRKVQADWQKKREGWALTPEKKKLVDSEVKARQGGVAAYAMNNWGVWVWLVTVKQALFFGVIEAFSVMLLGIALWKWGVIQGDRTRCFYLLLMLGCYGFGLTARLVGALEVTSFQPIPKTIWITEEFARIAVSVGHVALVNWAMQGAFGRRLFAPFKAAGRTAFSLYFLTSFIGLWVLFAPWGLIGWGRLGWAAMMGVATLVIAGLVVLANLWVRWFANGPLEWAWRSLAYWQRQPFRRPRAAEPLPGLNALPV